MLSRFFSGDNILFKIFSVLAASVKLAPAHPLNTLLLGLLTGGCILPCVEFWMWLAWLALPYVWAWLASLLLERVFKPFMEEQRKEQAGM